MLTVAMCAATVAFAATNPCRCGKAKPLRCADPTAKHRLNVHIDFTAVNGNVEVITQSGPYQLPAAALDGKTILFVVMPKGEVFQGFLQDVVVISGGPMQGTQATITTDAVFLPGEYELLLFIDVVAGGGVGPNHGDLAAFDNGTCDPTGVSIRFPVGCDDATVTLTNQNFIIF
jgi:hypothetical protein